MTKYRIEVEFCVCVTVEASDEADLTKRANELLQARFEDGEDLYQSDGLENPRLYIPHEIKYAIVDIEEVDDDQMPAV